MLRIALVIIIAAVLLSGVQTPDISGTWVARPNEDFEMVASGMRDAGYVYINIDDGWQGRRDADGVLQPNPNFPDMKALATYAHAKGLKLGIYSSPGPRTCGGYEGSYAHEEIDARTWAAWGIA
jgi:hypothetical protein